MGSPSEARTILVIVICLLFEICDLEFLVSSANSRIKEKPFLAPMPRADVGDGKIGKGEIARYICFQTMVYKEAKN